MCKNLRTLFVFFGLLGLALQPLPAVEQPGPPCVVDDDCTGNPCLTGTCILEPNTPEGAELGPALIPTGFCEIVSPGSSCPDTDGNVCSNPGCDPSGQCDQHFWDDQMYGYECPDTDDNVCTVARCDGAGICQQDLDTSTHSGEPCPDTDGIECTEAVCDGNGTCQQAYPADIGTPCGPTGNECLVDVCDGFGQCGVPQFGVLCTDTDGNQCTIARCDDFGSCDQTLELVESGAPCPDTDGIECTEAVCDGNGTCQQAYPADIGTPCGPTGNECFFDVCNGFGQCGIPNDGAPCTDTDGNVCTIAHCDYDQCRQDYDFEPSGTSCPDTANDCADAACDGSGICDQNYNPLAPGTPCAEGDSNACTTPACDGAGVCNQTYSVKMCLQDECNTGLCDATTGLCIPEADGTPCTDTDANTCTIAACELVTNGAAEPIVANDVPHDIATCNQTYAAEALGTACSDTDGEVCTAAACDGCGQCLQDFRNLCPGGGCRATGGGVVTNTFPAIRYATHGGQVGASLSGATGFTPNSACIKGQWTHVRHVGPGDIEEFHGRTYDSLMCACLGCIDDPSLTVQGDTCNPGDLQCGPGHPAAPANAICVSGVGDFAEVDEELQPRTVLFRIEVEDRGEPGKGVDKYRIRIWKLTETEGDPDDPASDAYRMRQGLACQAAWGVPAGEAPYDGDLPCGVRPPDIDDGNYLITGNQQLHKPTHANCDD